MASNFKSKDFNSINLSEIRDCDSHCQIHLSQNMIECGENIYLTRIHSSRIRTAHCSGCLSCHACPPPTHVPCHTCPPCHICLLSCMPPAMHAPSTHAPCDACPHHACPPPCMPPATHTLFNACPSTMHTPFPCGQTDTCENITFANFV